MKPLREQLHAPLGELGRGSFQRSEADGRTHSISTITAPVFDRHGEVAVAASLQVFAGDLDASGIAAIADPLVEMTRSLSRGEP